MESLQRHQWWRWRSGALQTVLHRARSRHGRLACGGISGSDRYRPAGRRLYFTSLLAFRARGRYPAAEPSSGEPLPLPTKVWSGSTAVLTGDARRGKIIDDLRHSHHREDARAQLVETLANLDSLLHKAANTAPRVPAHLGPNSLLKIYVRDRQALTAVETMLQERLPGTPRIVLAGDICREDLLIEADCVHSGSFAS